MTAKRQDVSPKEGEKKYGKGETFADPTNKKYPLTKGGELSEERIRAAWNYVNKPKNAAKYSSKDVASIKRKIISAWKKKIDKSGPPSAEGKSAYFYDDTANIDVMTDEQVGAVWDSMKSDMEMTDLELLNATVDVNLRAITDAPKLRAKDSQYCANCNFYKWFPNMRCYDEPMAERNLTSEDVEEIVEHQQMMRGICEEPSIEAEVGANWVCDKWEAYNWKDHMPDDAEEVDEEKALQLKTFSVDTVKAISDLKPIKMMGETRFGGYGVYFAREPKKEKDAVGTAFLKSTDFGEVYDHVPMLYHHGLTKAFDNDKIAKTVKAQVDDVGIWLEGELDRSKKYWQKVKANIEKGIYYFSGGTAEHLIRYGEDGVLKSFPIIEWSITTTPAEWRLGAAQFYKSIGIDLDSGAGSPADDKGKGDINESVSNCIQRIIRALSWQTTHREN